MNKPRVTSFLILIIATLLTSAFFCMSSCEKPDATDSSWESGEETEERISGSQNESDGTDFSGEDSRETTTPESSSAKTDLDTEDSSNVDSQETESKNSGFTGIGSESTECVDTHLEESNSTEPPSRESDSLETSPNEYPIESESTETSHGENDPYETGNNDIETTETHPEDSKPSNDDTETTHVCSYSEGIILSQPTCNSTGTKLYTCSECGKTKEEIIPQSTQHLFDSGIIAVKPTCNTTGIKLFTCSHCKTTREEIIEVIPPTYTITIEGVGNYFVDKDGVYDIGAHEKIGYQFIGWQTIDGKSFASSGVISGNITVIPIMRVIQTTTVEQLEAFAAAGVDKILIGSDIFVDRPIFIVGNTAIYADKDVKLVRAADYDGDIFVAGVDKNNVPSVLLGKNAVLTLGGGSGMLTVDGNKDNMTVTVMGSAIFVSDSATVNILDNTVIENHIKDGNVRAFICERYADRIIAERAGGAAILILNGCVNMYGGEIRNNQVRLEMTVRDDGNGNEATFEDAGCGGAVYNCGNFNMYGGTICNNQALRGGAIYNDEIIVLASGTICDNVCYYLGGAVSSSSSQTAQMFIGTESTATNDKMLFLRNRAINGGALYSNASSPIVILGNTRFEGNEADDGGAIYTSGALTIRSSEFIGNRSLMSGGAIYFWFNYQKTGAAYAVRRKMEITDCVFEVNSADVGGAIALSASDEAINRVTSGKSNPDGAYAIFTNCSFSNNFALNCGALYVERYSDVVLKNVEFSSNSADNFGGAMTVHTGCTATLNNVIFSKNKAKDAGALYIYSAGSLSLSYLTFDGNEATAGNGGALLCVNSTVTLSSTSSFSNNNAANQGGAIYATYRTDESNKKHGSTLNVTSTGFENNSALSGGAISADDSGKITVTSTSFKNCTTPSSESGSVNGGGAIYAKSCTLTLNNPTFDACASGYYGGSVMLSNATCKLTGGEIKNGFGGTGAAIYVNGGSFEATSLTVTNVVSSDNGVLYITNATATLMKLSVTDSEANKGGAVYVSGENTVLEITDGVFTNNNAEYGAAIYASKATVTCIGCSFTNCTSTNGDAVYSDLASVTY